MRTRLARRYLLRDTVEGGFGRIQGITKEIARERFETDKDRADRLGSFIRHGLTQEEEISETGLQFIAGNETTATAI